MIIAPLAVAAAQAVLSKLFQPSAGSAPHEAEPHATRPHAQKPATAGRLDITT